MGSSLPRRARAFCLFRQGGPRLLSTITAPPPAVDLSALLKRNKSAVVSFKRGEKPTVVILGSGWAGFQLARDIDKSKYKVVVISKTNHFLFTPLLPSTTVGTLEFRCIQEPVRTIPKVTFYQAEAERIDFESKRVVCKECFEQGQLQQDYDYLIAAVGARTNTFNTPGVTRDNKVYFLKSLEEARAIRSRIIECFERASYPALPEEERRRLLSFVVVGGGPTSVEFVSELHDFLLHDVHRWFADLEPLVSVTLVEASDHILGTFDQSLVQYASRLLNTRKVRVLTNTSVTKVEPQMALLKDGSQLPFGLCVWSTGVTMVSFIQQLDVEKGRGGRMLVDARLRLQGPKDQEGGVVPGVFALGDCAINADHPLPPLAQVARQQAKYLAQVFNKYQEPDQDPNVEPFTYRHLGSMAQLGMWKGVLDTSDIAAAKKASGPVLQGLLAWLIWRSAYWTRSVSLANKILIPMYWFRSWLFGRDISRF